MPPSGPHPRWQRTVQVVVVTQAAILIGFNLGYPFLPLLIQELGITDRGELALWTGLAIGLGSLAMAIASPIWGLLADRFGRKPMLVRSIAAGSILMVVQGAVESAWQLVFARILHGAFSGTLTAGAMLLAGIVPKERTGFALGMLNTAMQIGNLAGPILGGIAVALVGLRGSFFLGAVLLAVCAVVTLALVDDVAVVRSRPDAERPSAARDIVTPFAWPGLRGVLVVGTIVQVAYSGTIALVAIYVQDLARPSWLTLELTIALALAAGALASAVAMPILGAWADRHDPRALLAISLALVGIALVPQALIPNALAFLALRLAVGLGLAGVTSAMNVLTRGGAPAGGEGRAFGALSSAQNLGWAIGPILGAAFAALAGIPALYLAAAACTLLLVPVARMGSWFPVADARTPAVPVVTVSGDG